MLMKNCSFEYGIDSLPTGSLDVYFNNAEEVQKFQELMQSGKNISFIETPPAKPKTAEVKIDMSPHNDISAIMRDDVLRMVREQAKNCASAAARQQGKTSNYEALYPKIPTNPCSEIYLRNNGGWVGQNEVATEYKGIFDEGKKMSEDKNKPHSQRVGIDSLERYQTINVAGQGINGSLKVTDEQLIFTVTLPGVEADRIEVTRVDQNVRIRIAPEKGDEGVDFYSQRSNTKQVTLILDEEEEIVNTELRLGILTITIDRGRVVETVTVNARD